MAVKANDPINPDHYKSHPSGIECIQIVEHMGFCIGNAIKYLWRAGSKPGVDAIEDLKKAQWYINREIQRLETTATRKPYVCQCVTRGRISDYELPYARSIAPYGMDGWLANRDCHWCHGAGRVINKTERAGP